MKIKEAKSFFEKILEYTKIRSQRKTCNLFLGIFAELEKRNLLEKDILLIEEELFRLNLAVDIEDRPAYLKQRLREFKSFLKGEFGFVVHEDSPDEYTAYGMVIGMLASFFIPPLSLTFGFLAGLIIGAWIGDRVEEKARREGKVLYALNYNNTSTREGWSFG